MFTKCKNCGKELSIHIFSSSEEWEKEVLYCAQCASYQQKEYESSAELFCHDCGTRYNDFLERGYLACASCYSAFASQLEELIEKYHHSTLGKKPFVLAYRPPPIALARSQELCEYVLAEEERVYDPCKQDKKLKRDISRKSPLAYSSAETQKISLKVYVCDWLAIYRDCLIWAICQENQKEDLSRNLLSQKSALTLYLGTPKGAPVKFDTKDEDHLRVSWLFAWQAKGHCMEQLFNCLKQIELLDKLYQWQFHPDYGFLTACPALAGHALRLSFQLQIPALKAKVEVWQSWHANLSRAGYEIRSTEREKDSLSKKSSIKNSIESSIKNPRADTGAGGIQISNRHWVWGVSPEEEIQRFFLVLESLLEAEFKAKM